MCVRNAEAAGSNPARSTTLKFAPNCGVASFVSEFIPFYLLIADFKAFSHVFEIFKPTYLLLSVHKTCSLLLRLKLAPQQLICLALQVTPVSLSMKQLLGKIRTIFCDIAKNRVNRLVKPQFRKIRILTKQRRR